MWRSGCQVYGDIQPESSEEAFRILLGISVFLQQSIWQNLLI